MRSLTILGLVKALEGTSSEEKIDVSIPTRSWLVAIRPKQSYHFAEDSCTWSICARWRVPEKSA